MRSARSAAAPLLVTIALCFFAADSTALVPSGTAIRPAGGGVSSSRWGSGSRRHHHHHHHRSGRSSSAAAAAAAAAANNNIYYSRPSLRCYLASTSSSSDQLAAGGGSVVPPSSQLLSSNPNQAEGGGRADAEDEEDGPLSSLEPSLAPPLAVPVVAAAAAAGIPSSSSTAIPAPATKQRGPQLPPSIKLLSPNRAAILSASVLILLDVAFRRLFERLAITSFPSSLGGCCALLLAMLLLPGKTTTRGDRLYSVLAPGASLLAKWLPVFFVPSLVTLPLVGRVGSSPEILKVLAVIVGGFYFTLLSTAGSVVGVTRLFGKGGGRKKGGQVGPPGDVAVDAAGTAAAAPPPPPPPKPFSDGLMRDLRVWAGATGAAALLAFEAGGGGGGMLHAMATPLASAFLLTTTLAAFVYGARLPKKFTKVVHPLVTCTSLTWVACAVFGFMTQRSFPSVLRLYRVGGGIRGLHQTGPGDVLLFLLGPAVLSLAVNMYEKRQLVRDNAGEVAAGVAVSSVGGLLGTAFMVRLLNLAQPALRVALLSRNITSPLAMAIAGILGGGDATTISLAVSMVVVTGLLGANFGAAILSSLRIESPVARGMGMGAAAHGLGTAAIVNEKDAFPFAAISMALTATACTVLVSVPAIKRLVLAIALGGAA